MFSAKRLSFIAAALLLAGAGCFGTSTTSTGSPTGPGSAAVTGNGAPGAGTPSPEPVSPPATGRTKTITLRAVAGSGEYGTATFTDVGDNETKVVIRLTGAPKETAQPAAITLGDCGAAPGGTKWDLPLIIDGKADTTLGAKYSELFPGGSVNYSLRVRKDAIQTTGETYAACGDLL